MVQPGMSGAEPPALQERLAPMAAVPPPSPASPVGPAPAFRPRRNSMLPVQRRARDVASNLERAMYGRVEEEFVKRANSEPSTQGGRGRAGGPRARLMTMVEQPVTRAPEDYEQEPEDEADTATFLVEDIKQQEDQRAEAGAHGLSAVSSLSASISVLKMKQKLSARWKATISVDMWLDLKNALDIPPEQRTLTHCMDIDNWISKVYILRSLRKRQRQDICKWVQYKSYDTMQKIFERGDSAADDNFYMIFSGTLAVLTPERTEEPLFAPGARNLCGARSLEDRADRPSPRNYDLDSAVRGVVQARSRSNQHHSRAAHLKVLSSGDCFGDLALMDRPDKSQVTRTATVEARSPCMLLIVPRKHFLKSALRFTIHERLTKVRALRSNQFFQNWPLDALLLISYHCIRREYNAGDVIIDGDKENAHAYAVLEGSCTLAVDSYTSSVTDGFALGLEMAFDERRKKKGRDQQPGHHNRDHLNGQGGTGNEPQADEPPPRYHAVADTACVVYMVSHEMLRTLAPSKIKSVLAELGKFRLSTLSRRAERRRIQAAKTAAEMARAAQKQAVVEAGDMRAREAWISAQKRAVELRPPPASMGTSPHLLLNTDAALRDLQRAERRAHLTLLTEAAVTATSASEPHASLADGTLQPRLDVRAAVQAVATAQSTVQKIQSSVVSLKAEIVQYGMLLRNAGRYEVHRLSAAVERLIGLIVEAMQPDTLLTTVVRRGLTFKQETAASGRIGSSQITTLNRPQKKEQAARRQTWLAEVSIFKVLPPESRFFNVLATKLTSRTVQRKMVVVEKDSIGTEMYFIVNGEVDILASLDEPPFVTLGVGAHFGEGSLLTEEPRNAYVRASKSLDLFVLSKADLHAVFLEFPDVKRMLYEHAAAEEKQSLRAQAEQQAAANALAAEEIAVEHRRKKRNSTAPAHSLEEIIRQLNLCSRLCSRAAVLLAICVTWHVDGNPSNKDGEMAQQVAQRFATRSADLKAAVLQPVEMLHQMLRRSDPRVMTTVA